jgi:hypothetical protein
VKVIVNTCGSKVRWLEVIRKLYWQQNKSSSYLKNLRPDNWQQN